MFCSLQVLNQIISLHDITALRKTVLKIKEPKLKGKEKKEMILEFLKSLTTISNSKKEERMRGGGGGGGV